jgi:hypothetical protein
MSLTGRELGLHRAITRRDFMNGAELAIGGFAPGGAAEAGN